jgi:hypothetical protein
VHGAPSPTVPGGTDISSNDNGDGDISTPLTAPAPTGRWRVGRHLGRTIYDGDSFEGILESRELAARVVDLLNAQT